MSWVSVSFTGSSVGCDGKSAVTTEAPQRRSSRRGGSQERVNVQGSDSTARLRPDCQSFLDHVGAKIGAMMRSAPRPVRVPPTEVGDARRQRPYFRVCGL
jgi:hypothetical protein